MRFDWFPVRQEQALAAKQPSMTDEDNRPTTVVRHCDTLEEFLHDVSPRSRILPQIENYLGARSWLYRGHADADWVLTPSALRENSAALRPHSLFGIETTADQIFAERNALSEFYQASDDAGLSIPEDNQAVRRLMTEHRAPRFWPPDEILSLMAIAQHHGLPTRLLDWSLHPLKAAYFAASKAVSPDFKSSSGRIAVWIMTRHVVVLGGGSPPLRLVTAPASSNSNLRAQEGVFICAHAIEANDAPIDRDPVDKILADAKTRASTNNAMWIMPSLYHITLPLNKAAELLLELARDGVTRAKLYPDYYAVVQGMRETRLQKRP